MEILQLNSETKQNILEHLLKRSPNHYAGYESRVAEIIAKVREKKDEAVFGFTEQFDGVKITAETVRVTDAEIRSAYEKIDEKLLSVIRKAKENIRAYHEKQRQYSWFDSDERGILLGQKITPLEREGVYVPGGNAMSPSSVLMTVIPAKVAGVSDIILSTPPGSAGTVYPVTLPAA